MAVVFPLAISVFADVLQPLATGFRWQLQRYMVTSGTAGGDIITAEVAFPKWTAAVPLNPMLMTTANLIQSQIEALEGAGSDGTFYLYDLRKAGPRNSKTGSLFASKNPIVSAIAGDNASIGINGMPANFSVIRGDHVSITLASGRRGYHRVTQSAASDASGHIASLPVTPPLKTGTAVNQAVTFYKGLCRCIVLPGSFTTGTPDGRFVSGMFFTALETA